MRPCRSARALACVAVLLLAPSSNAAGPSREPRERPPGAVAAIRTLAPGQKLGTVQVDDHLQVVEVGGARESRRYLVMLDEPAGASTADAAGFAARVSARQALARSFADELAARAGRFAAPTSERPRVLRSYDRLIAGAVVLAPPDAEATLRAIPGVRDVFPDGRVTAFAGENLAQVRADRVQQELGGSGLGVRVGIVDSGIDYTHPALGGGFGPGFRVAGGWDFVNGDPDPRDDDGHGTHVAGIVAGNGGGVLGVAPAATLYAFKVLDAEGTGALSDVIAALEGCADPDGNPGTDDRLDVVNVSLGGETPYDRDPTSLAVDALDALGTVVVVASGNSGIPFSVATPATARGAITVGSVSPRDSLARASSRGPTLGLRIKPDLVAPGELILSARLGGGTESRSGTSMAAPHVAGAAALLRQLHPDWTHDELRSALVTQAVDLQRPASEQGNGRLDAYAAATASLFVSPTSLAFGSVSPNETGWSRTQVLRFHSRAAGVTNVSLSLTSSRLPPWLEASLSTTGVALDPGVTGEVTLTLRSTTGHPPLLDPQYIAEGVVVVEANGQTCRVPFSIHEALQVDVTAFGLPSPGVVFGQGRAWRSLSPFSARWLLQPGIYDVLAFNHDLATRDLEPILGVTDISVANDLEIPVVRSTATSDLTWALRNERGAPHVPQTLSVQWSSDGGGAVAFLGIRTPTRLTFPVMKSNYRLDWWAWDTDGANRYDIVGVERAPLSNHLVGNDPAALRRLVEHVHVPAGDSLVLQDELRFTEGFRIAYADRFAAPFGESFDIGRWTAPIPDARPMRYGHRTWSIDPAKARASDPQAIDPLAFNGLGPLWDQRHGDTLEVRRSFGFGEPDGRFTGRDLPFGSGAAFPNAVFQFIAGTVEVIPNDVTVPWLFRDAAGSIASGPPPAFEIHRGSIVLLGTVSREELLANHRWSTTVPEGPLDLVLRSRGWTVAGRPSTTTVTVSFDQLLGCPSPEWFTIVAGGAPVERIVFGQQRDPHVELRFPILTSDTPLTLDVRAGASGAWTPLVVERDGRSVRAKLPRMIGDVSLRMSVGAVPDLFAPMTIEIAPAFVGLRSPAEDAQVVEGRADANGAHVAWRVGVPGATLLVERIEPNADWEEHGEVIVDPDGIARFEDPAVAPGGRYGYRLGGSEASVFVEVPAAQAGLALAIRPNPASDGLLASVTLDRVAPVTIRVHDVQGRLVAARTWSGLAPGAHVLAVMPRGKAKAGLYFVRLECEGRTRDRRVTILE